MTRRFVRALSLSSRLLAAACGAALASSALLTMPGCLGRCYEYDTRITLVRQESPTTATLRGVLGGATWIAVGDGGVVLTRDDEGTWTARASGTTADLHAIARNEPGDVVLAVGAGGTVLRGDTTGLSWGMSDAGVEATLRAVDFDDAGLAIAVGDGVVLRSDDRGVTWVPATVPAMPAGLRAVAHRVTSEPAGEWLAVGDAGTAVSSLDGGLTWETVTVPVAGDLRAVAVSFEVDGWVIAAADGTALRGRLGELEVVTVADPTELHALSPEGGWLVGADGAVRALEFDGSVGGYTVADDDPEGARLLAVAVNGETVVVGEGGTILGAALTSVETDSRVCRTNPTIVEGRPFVVDEEARTAEAVRRDDWCDAVEVAALPARTRARLAAAWTRDGLYEHASVASFARFVLQLLAVGAPPDLVLAGQEALADEVRHARACFGLASAYAGAPVGPGPIAVDGALAGASDLAALAEATAVEGCVNETIAALVASTAAELAEDPAVRARLTAIAADERRHAALAWKTVAWALGRGDAGVRAAVARAFAVAPTPDDEAGEDGLQAHGRLSRHARVAVARVAWQEIIAPQAAALLAASGVAAASAVPLA